MTRTLLLIAAGGVAGTLARFGLGQWLRGAGGPIALGTLLANLAGSALLGFVLKSAALDEPALVPVRAGLAVGFCGAFTTLSTFSVELLTLLERRLWGWAALYLALTVGGGLLAAAGGYLLASRAG